MTERCNATTAEVGNGVASALQAVDCVANEVTSAAFGRLFAPGGAMGPTLSLLLAIFVALFAVALMLGRTNLSIKSVVPRMVTLGMVVTFATSWAAYQGVVWNLAIGAPDYVATMLTGDEGSATTVFAQKLDVVFAAIEQATLAPLQAAAQGGAAAGVLGPNGNVPEITAFSPEGILWMGAMLLLLGTAGVLVTARIGLAVLVALGPIFVVLLLFPATRGLFAGWVKGVVMLALTPLFAVLAGGIMLELSVPVLSGLSQLQGQIDLRSAVAFFLIAAVHCALMVMVLKISSTMVAGWTVFGLTQERSELQISASQVPVSATSPIAHAVTGGAQAAAAIQTSRRIPAQALAAVSAANDSGSLQGGSAASVQRETRIYTSSSGGSRENPGSSSPARTHGIGSRFRAANGRQTGTVR